MDRRSDNAQSEEGKDYLDHWEYYTSNFDNEELFGETSASLMVDNQPTAASMDEIVNANPPQRPALPSIPQAEGIQPNIPIDASHTSPLLGSSQSGAFAPLRSNEPVSNAMAPFASSTESRSAPSHASNDWYAALQSGVAINPLAVASVDGWARRDGQSTERPSTHGPLAADAKPPWRDNSNDILSGTVPMVPTSFVTTTPPESGWLASGTAPQPPVAATLPYPFRCKPLTCYNYFYRDERDNIVEQLEKSGDPLPDPVSDFSAHKMEHLLHQHWYVDSVKGKRPHRKVHGKIEFPELSKVIAQRWKGLSHEGREFYRQVARADQDEYERYLQACHQRKPPPQPR